MVTPPKPNRYMTYANAPFMKKVLHITKRKRKPDVQHHSQADDLRARFEAPEWGVFCQTARLRNGPARLKLVLSDSPPGDGQIQLINISQLHGMQKIS